MIETIATVESNIELAPGYRLLTLVLDQELKVRPGQFAMLKPHGSLEPLLRRALAIYRALGPHRISFLYQVLGRGTAALARAARGTAMEALLPLGNSWLADGFRGDSALVVAGGIGSASVLSLCDELKRLRVETTVFFGAASEGSATGCGLEDFRALEIPLIITTDDGSLGERGFVTPPLERHLRERSGARPTIFACGPWVMMKRVAEIAALFDAGCLLSLEAPMGCGFGVCVGCVVAVKEQNDEGYHSFKRVCTDGSIFPAETIRWEINAMSH